MKKNIVVLSDWNKNQLPLHDDKVNVKMKKAHVASTPAGVVALKAWALASSMIFFTLTLVNKKFYQNFVVLAMYTLHWWHRYNI